MRYDKLTTKFQAALQEAQSQAMASDCGYLEAVHVLQALLNDNDSGIAALLVQAGGNITQIKQGVQAALNALPKVIRTRRRNDGQPRAAKRAEFNGQSRR